MRALTLGISMLCVACAKPGAPAERAAAPTTPATPPDGPATPAAPRAAAATTREPAAGEADKPAQLFPDAAFPPASIIPPHARSRQDGDGQWQAFGAGERGDRLAEPPYVVYRTVIHPHPASKWAKLTLAAIDLRNARVDYLPGTEDVTELESRGGVVPPKEMAIGLVPERQQESLLVVFNGGFKPRHGRWGMRAQGTTLLPPRDEACTVAIDARGAVTVSPWQAIAAGAEQLWAFRQAPPCLVSDGALHPLLENHNERAWGGFDPKRKTRRRSALGVDASGRVLLYGIGEEMGPRLLAQGMRYAGAVNAAQLDINWSWTRFLVFGQTGEGELSVTSTLIPEMVHQKHGYVAKPAARDFFYIMRREARQATSNDG